MALDLNVITSVLAVLSPFFLAVIGGIGYLYRHEKERRESVERQLSEKKYETYITLIDIFFELMKLGRVNNPKKLASILDRMYDANKNLMLYGSDEVINTYQKFLETARKNGKADLNLFGNIIIAIRKDMGNPKTKITSDDILRQLLRDYDDAKAKGLI